jgi:hypothetical protein
MMQPPSPRFEKYISLQKNQNMHILIISKMQKYTLVILYFGGRSLAAAIDRRSKDLFTKEKTTNIPSPPSRQRLGRLLPP